jgi:hypothetical protein
MAPVWRFTLIPIDPMPSLFPRKSEYKKFIITHARRLRSATCAMTPADHQWVHDGLGDVDDKPFRWLSVSRVVMWCCHLTSTSFYLSIPLKHGCVVIGSKNAYFLAL